MAMRQASCPTSSVSNQIPIVMNLVQPNFAHWYQYKDSQWLPFWEVPRSDGTGTRRTTLADARKISAVPSVTNVLSVLNRPQLNDWRVEQAILASLTLPRHPDELVDEFVKRVVRDADAQSEKARDFGSDIHSAIEAEVTSTTYTAPPELEPYLPPIRQWLKENITGVHGAEIIVGDRELGFAGRLDLDCELKGIGRCVLDFKSQSVKNGKPAWYNEFVLQLAAYEYCRNRELGLGPEMKLASVIIDKLIPGGIYLKVWDDADTYFEHFHRCLELWQFQKSYSPTKD